MQLDNKSLAIMLNVVGTVAHTGLKLLKINKDGHVASLAFLEIPLFSQQICYRLQLFNMLRYNFQNDNNWNTEQHTPDTPQPTPEQQ